MSINSGHYLELMDRLHVMSSTVNDYALLHPLTERDPQLQAIIETAIQNLLAAYQYVGDMIKD